MQNPKSFPETSVKEPWIELHLAAVQWGHVALAAYRTTMNTNSLTSSKAIAGKKVLKLWIYSLSISLGLGSSAFTVLHVLSPTIIEYGISGRLLCDNELLGWECSHSPLTSNRLGLVRRSRRRNKKRRTKRQKGRGNQKRWRGSD